MPKVTALAVSVVATALAATACVRRADYAVPDPPAPLVAEAAAPAVPATIDGPLTPDRVLALVRDRNPSVAQARARLEAALGGLDAAESALSPRLGAEASYVQSNAPSTYLFKRIDSHTLPQRVDFNDPGRTGNFDLGLALRWNVWDGGRTRLGVWAADADAEGARRAETALRNALGGAALAAFLDARAADALLASDDASIRTVESQVADTRTRVEGGAALRSDLLSLEVRLAEAKERRIRTDVARRLALTSLRTLLALPAGAPLTLGTEPFDAGPLPATLPAALDEAWSTRADVAAARRAVESAQLRLAAAERGDLPRVDLEARTWSGTGDTSLGFHDPNWTVALAVSFDLVDGGATRAQVRRAKAALAEVKEADRAAFLAAASDVETALLRLEEARARVDVTGQAVAASEESLRLVETQFRGGGTTVTRFLETEGAHANARAGQIAARLALEVSLVDTARALGRLGQKETVR